MITKAHVPVANLTSREEGRSRVKPQFKLNPEWK